MDVSTKFHVENNCIITTVDEVTAQETYDFLKGRLEDFRVGSQFIVVCGVHGKENGSLGKSDLALTNHYQAMFNWLQNRPVVSNIVIDRKYSMGKVIPVSSEEDEDITGKFVLKNGSKAAIKIEFHMLLSNKLPIVLVVASCWSFKSALYDELRSAGLFAVMNMSEDLGKITDGKLFLLDDQQQDILKLVTNDDTKKDVVVSGENCIKDDLNSVEIHSCFFYSTYRTIWNRQDMYCH